MNDLMISLHDTQKNVGRSLQTLQENELNYIKEVLEITDYNIKKTAEILGISRSRLYRKMKMLDIPIDEEEISTPAHV